MNRLGLKKSKKEKKSNRWIMIIIVGILLFGAFKITSRYGMEFANYMMFTFQKKIYGVGKSLENTNNAILKYNKILKENEKLRIKDINLSHTIDENRDLVRENKALRKILMMRNRLGMGIKIAKINFRKQSNLYEKFYIDLGRQDGIQKNMVVMTQNNVLIGCVSYVYKDYSIVRMITGQNSSVSALSQNSNTLGLVKGSNEDDGTLYFEPSAFNNTLSVGEKIYTSGISEIYPKGLYIGYISKIDADKEDIFKSIYINNGVDILNMEDVVVLIPQKIDKKDDIK